MLEQTCQDLLVPGGELARWDKDCLLLLNILRVHAMVQGNDLLGRYLCMSSTLMFNYLLGHLAAQQCTRILQYHQSVALNSNFDVWTCTQHPCNGCTQLLCSPLFSAIRSSVSPFRTVYGLTFKSAVTTVRAWVRGWLGRADSCKEGHGHADPGPKIPSCVDKRVLYATKMQLCIGKILNPGHEETSEAELGALWMLMFSAVQFQGEITFRTSRVVKGRPPVSSLPAKHYQRRWPCCRPSLEPTSCNLAQPLAFTVPSGAALSPAPSPRAM